MNKTIPDLSRFRSTKPLYRLHPISPVKDVCIRFDPSLCRSYYWHYKPRPEGAREEIFLRERLALKLDKINKTLSFLGLRLLIQEGYRPLPVQKFVQEVSVLKGLRKENPDLSEMELQEKVKMFAASINGDLRNSPPPHLTGGAVDLTIVCLETEKQVDMGKSDGLYKNAFPDALEKIEGFEEARRLRRLLFWLATEQGMATNPTEWWHLSWGDQMWAFVTGKSHAIYGEAKYFDERVP
jgi:D-alanyl-D-alanine dipeptidase